MTRLRCLLGRHEWFTVTHVFEGTARTEFGWSVDRCKHCPAMRS